MRNFCHFPQTCFSLCSPRPSPHLSDTVINSLFTKDKSLSITHHCSFLLFLPMLKLFELYRYVHNITLGSIYLPHCNCTLTFSVCLYFNLKSWKSVHGIYVVRNLWISFTAIHEVHRKPGIHSWQCHLGKFFQVLRSHIFLLFSITCLKPCHLLVFSIIEPLLSYNNNIFT